MVNEHLAQYRYNVYSIGLKGYAAMASQQELLQLSLCHPEWISGQLHQIVDWWIRP